jgi:amidophosphoribosyltransferase
MVEDTLSFDKFREECGLFAVWNNLEAANLTYLGLYAQQHRGQEGAGVVAFDDKGMISSHKDLGLVDQVFDNYDFTRLPGVKALGHVRYTTAGGNLLANVQPFYAELGIGKVAVAHNGNLINVDALKDELVSAGAIFRSTSDTELFLHLMARPGNNPDSQVDRRLESVFYSLRKVKGAYSLAFLFDDRLLAVRDPKGLRPLSLGKLDKGWVVASETCAFDLVGATYVRDILPGEVLEIKDGEEPRSYFPLERTTEAPCVFEYIYFARPDSDVYGRNVYRVRKALGVELAKQSKVKADFVVPVLDSGLPAAVGYAEESGIPLELALIRNHYVGRTFIEPKQSIRDFGVKIKLNANKSILNGKSIVVVDDSIVRGTTSRKLVKMLKAAGAKEVHMRISSPPTIDPCYYGIDTPEKGELIASRMSVDEISKYLEVDSLEYLSTDAIYAAIACCKDGDTEEDLKGKFCDACFTGVYPLGIPEDFKDQKV